MEHPQLVPALAAAGVIAVTFICTLAESCLRNLTPAEIARFTVHHPLVADILEKFKNNRLYPLATLSILQFSALLYGLSFFFRNGTLQHRTFAVAVLLFTYLLVSIGVILPRALGNRYREPLAFIFALPLRLTTALLYPLTAPLIFISRRCDRSAKPDPAVVTNDIVLLAHEAVAAKALSRQQGHLISRSIELSRITAADIMVERSEIRPIADTNTLADALVEAHLHHHTRFPLTHGGDIDQITGYVNFKDIVGALRLNPADPTLCGIRRPIESVGAATPLPELLQLFTRGRQHIVIVKGIDGRTLGMVTLEDLLEILVGDLEDEYDTPPDFVVQLGERRFCAGGGTTFSQLRRRVAPDFPDWDVTINEWISGQNTDTIPEKYSTAYERHTFTVRKVTRGKVFDVIIDKGEPVATAPQP